MEEKFALTLYDYKNDLQWVRMLGWSDEDLRKVPVHEEATSNEDYLNLSNFGGTPLGVTTRGGGGPTSANIRAGIKNLYVYARETPRGLYDQLYALLQRGGPSAYEESGIFGERGEASDFPPKEGGK